MERQLLLRIGIWIYFLFFFSLFSVSGQYVLNGSANQQGNCFRLTPATTFRTGSAWYLDKVDISDGFDLYFDIYLGCNDANGADGMAFVLQQVSTSVGTTGEGLGYQGVAPSLAIEFDTWQNPNRNDPTFDHLAIMQNGFPNHGTANELAGPVGILPGNVNAEDCAYHSLRVTWDANTQIIQVFVDCNLRLTYTGDIVNNIFNGDPEVFWGFTGATGGFVNEHFFCLDYIS
ncbi:MAG: L-type lectin-domain containing protein, partial [Bacteroidota bacterium]